MISAGDHVLLSDGLVHFVIQNWRRPRDEPTLCFDIPCQRESVVTYKTQVSVTKGAVTCMTCVAAL